MPNDYYKQEVFKLIQKEKRLKEDKYSFNGKIRDLEREIDFQKSTMEKEMFLLQLELKESKSSVVFLRKLLLFCVWLLLLCCCQKCEMKCLLRRFDVMTFYVMKCLLWDICVAAFTVVDVFCLCDANC